MSLADRFGDGRELVDQLGAMLRTDGLSDLLAGFNDAGRESVVESWLGSGTNEPTDAGTVERAVGRGRLGAMAAQLGASPEEVADGLARVIPDVVDRLTPGGARPSGAQLDQLDLGSLLADVDVAGLLR
jgi:uncharacterized protein YidB (DUF937 family)